MNDQTIEQEIQAKGLTAPRVTPADIKAAIASEHYFTAADGVDGAGIASLRAEDPHQALTITALDDDVSKAGTPMETLGLLTFCVLVLKNGFTVSGESACASPENFDAELGRQIARRNAEAKIWPLLGFELRTKLAAEREEWAGGQ